MSRMPNNSQKWLGALDVLVPFTRNYSAKIHASNITKITKVPQKTVYRKLELLVKNNFLDYTREGKNKLYFLRQNQQSTFSLLNLIENFKSLNFVSNYPNIAIMLNEISETFILFGSYAKGLAKTSSDIDIVVIGKQNKKLDMLVEKYPFEVNILYFTFTDFEKILRKKEHLAVEIIKDHIFFGDKEKLIKLLIKHNKQ